MKVKKGDVILIIILIAVVIGWFGKDILWPDTANKQAVIEVDGEVYITIPLNKSNERKEIPLNLPDHNFVHIVSDKEKIWVEDASCPDKVCVKTGKITKPGQSIVCLPNKTVVYIEGEADSEVDDITY